MKTFLAFWRELLSLCGAHEAVACTVAMAGSTSIGGLPGWRDPESDQKGKDLNKVIISGTYGAHRSPGFVS